MIIIINNIKEIFLFVRTIPIHNVLVIGEDMNVQIGKNENNKFCFYNSSNRNGEHLIDFSLENGLTCLNTKFQKRKEKLWIDIYANNAKAQIDYIVVNKKWIISALNCEAYSSFEGVSSEHWIVTAKIHRSLRRNRMQTTKTIQNQGWSLLNNWDISDKFTLTQKINSMLFRRYPKHSKWRIWEFG